MAWRGTVVIMSDLKSANACQFEPINNYWCFLELETLPLLVSTGSIVPGTESNMIYFVSRNFSSLKCLPFSTLCIPKALFRYVYIRVNQ